MSVITLFILVSSFGIVTTMNVSHDGTMINCPLMTTSVSFCKMNLADHLNWWKELFVGIFVFFILSTILINRLTYATLAPPQMKRLFLFQKQHPDIKLQNWLAAAFSDGILHPKIY